MSIDHLDNRFHPKSIAVVGASARSGSVGGDIIDYLSADPKMGSIDMYVESLSSHRHFMSAARAAGRIKPIIVLKAGRSRAGASATASHMDHKRPLDLSRHRKGKKMSRKKVCAIIGTGVIFLFTVAACSDSLSRSFYTHNPKSVQEVESVWGQPVDITQLEGDIEKRTYMIQSTDFDLKYRYFLIQDGMVLASGITDTGKSDSPGTHQETVGFVASDISKIFYARHHTTIDHLDQTWGTPLRVEDADDGTQYRVYEINDAYSDFRFRKFVVKNGIVVASRISPEPGFITEPVNGGYKGVEINEISHRYYQRHPMSLEAVETTWGEPVSIRKMKAGQEKRTYKLKMPTDAAFAFRFFIIDAGMVVSSGISDTLHVVAN